MSTQHWTEYFGLPNRSQVEAEMPQVGDVWFFPWYDDLFFEVVSLDAEPAFVGGGGYHTYRQVLESTPMRRVTRLFSPQSCVPLGRKVVIELVDGRRRIECVAE